jgi:hypothetical protein
LVGFEFVAAEDGGDDEGEFHLKDNKSVARFWVAVLGVSGWKAYLCDVTSDARARAV